MKRPMSLRHKALMTVAVLFGAEVLAQAMLGRAVMAQLLAPSVYTVPALVLVLVTLLGRLFLIVVLPAAAAAYLVFALRRADL